MAENEVYKKIWIFSNRRFVTEKYYKEQIKKVKEESRKEALIELLTEFDERKYNIIKARCYIHARLRELSNQSN